MSVIVLCVLFVAFPDTIAPMNAEVPIVDSRHMRDSFMTEGRTTQEMLNMDALLQIVEKEPIVVCQQVKTAHNEEDTALLFVALSQYKCKLEGLTVIGENS
jgi:hypothetical protein